MSNALSVASAGGMETRGVGISSPQRALSTLCCVEEVGVPGGRDASEAALEMLIGREGPRRGACAECTQCVPPRSALFQA